MRVRELAYGRPRFGYRRIAVLLRREGWVVNLKKVLRTYREGELLLRTKRRRKRIATRECLCLHPGRSLRSVDVTEARDRVIAKRGAPEAITLDTGTEFTATHFD